MAVLIIVVYTNYMFGDYKVKSGFLDIISPKCIKKADFAIKNGPL